MAALLLACVLAIALGFAAHRASICTVRAVAEVMTARTAHMFACLGKSVLWVGAVTLPFIWLVPSSATNLTGWPFTLAAMAGGLLFGIGAGINGACAYSTMARLADGDLRMLATIGAFAFGVLAYATLIDWHWVVRPSPTPTSLGSAIIAAAVLAAILVAWALYEFVRLWRTRQPELGITKRILAVQYRLSTTALIMGVATAVLILLYGPLGYTSTFEQVIEATFGTRPWPTTVRWILIIAILAGMVLSTVQRGTFRLDWRPQRGWLQNIGGGFLMGLGVALTPGGNDALVLYGIPSWSPHALPAYGALVIGIAAGLLLMRALFGIETRAVCRNDLYISLSMAANAKV
jgi:uncharacterized protein